MTKYALIGCAALALALYIVWGQWEKTKKELAQEQILHAQAQETIKLKDKAIKASDDALLQLKKDDKQITVERVQSEVVFVEVMKKQENADWGNTLIPQDVRDFVLNPEGVTQ